VILYHNNHQSNQKFLAKPVGNGYYNIRAMHSKLSIKPGSSYSLIQAPTTSKRNQQWKFVPTSKNSEYYIQNRADDRVMQVSTYTPVPYVGGSGLDGTRLLTAKLFSRSNQRFYIDRC
jgi:hypothetical protein